MGPVVLISFEVFGYVNGYTIAVDGGRLAR
jgi:hypothetical protein